MHEPVTRRRVIATVGTVALAGVAGCSSGSASGDTTTTTTPAETDHGHADAHHEQMPDEPSDHVEVRMVTDGGEYHYDPHVAWVTPGGTVTWTNVSGSHTTTAYHPDNDGHPLRIPEGVDPWDSGLFTASGETFERTFDTPGVYDYYCTPHEAAGMIGTVLVGEPDLHDQPGMTAPSEQLPETARHKIKELNGMVDEILGHHHE